MTDDLELPADDAGTDPPDDAAGAAAAGSPPALTLTPEQIRNSPEFKALAKQNRKLAREAGTANTAAAAARTAAEEARQAAEAQQQAALEDEITAALGEEGVAFWTEFAELSSSDPRAAARRLGEVLATARAQSADGGSPPADGDPAAAGGDAAVPPTGTPPPPARGVDGGAPLGAATTGVEWQQEVSALEKIYSDVVERNQDPINRNRVTMRDRASGFIAYLGASLVKAKNAPPDR